MLCGSVNRRAVWGRTDTYVMRLSHSSVPLQLSQHANQLDSSIREKVKKKKRIC